MKPFHKSLLAATAMVTLMTAPALAQTASGVGAPAPVIVDQVQLDNVWSDIRVHVDSSDQDVIGTSLSTSNTSTITVDSGAVAANVSQVSAGAAETNLDIWAGDVSQGQLLSSSNGTGNSSFIANWDGNADISVRQEQLDNVTALSRVDVENTQLLSTQATAVANVSDIQTDFGDSLNASQNQFADSSVFASSQSSAGFVQDLTQNTAIAAGNSSSVFADTVPGVQLGGSQVIAEDNTIVSSAQTYVEDTFDVFTTSAAAGNQLNVSLNNEANTVVGAPGQDFFQGNGADVFASADTSVVLFGGTAVSSANGVGNSLQISALGGSTNTAAVQNSSGSVGTNVVLDTGQFNGGAGLANATSIGNSFSAIAQDGTQGGRAIQTSAGSISANTTVRSGAIGSVNASATAIGNTATFELRANNNGQP